MEESIYLVLVGGGPGCRSTRFRASSKRHLPSFRTARKQLADALEVEPREIDEVARAVQKAREGKEEEVVMRSHQHRNDHLGCGGGLSNACFSSADVHSSDNFNRRRREAIAAAWARITLSATYGGTGPTTVATYSNSGIDRSSSEAPRIMVKYCICITYFVMKRTVGTAGFQAIVW